MATAGEPALAVTPPGILMAVILYPLAAFTGADVPVVFNVNPAPITTSLQTGVAGIGIPTGSGSTCTVTVNELPKHPAAEETGTTVSTTFADAELTLFHASSVSTVAG